jgi:SAM-dependent methyltransferase/uncharacterized protein YbaR (Trm112 family)
MQFCRTHLGPFSHLGNKTMIDDIIQYLICPNCRDHDHQLDLLPIIRDNDGYIMEGILVCTSCNSWFPITDGILELVSGSLADITLLDAFGRRHRDFLEAKGVQWRTEGGNADNVDPEREFEQQLKQRSHFEWYAENETQSYIEYQRMPFWRVFDDRLLGQWRDLLYGESLILDLACGDGRCALGFAKENRILACDISRNQIKNAIRNSKASGYLDKTFFFVADASAPPVKPGSFDAVTCYGALHHLPDAALAFTNAVHTLKPHGYLLASEPNFSFFRPAFDFLMRLFPIWYEEANDDPLISQKMVSDWQRAAGVITRTDTSVFVPPHLINILGYKWGRILFNLTEATFSRIPFARSNGGIINIQAQRS